DSLLLLQTLEAVGAAESAALHRDPIEPVADAADMAGAGDVRPDLNSLGAEPRHELAHRGPVLSRVADQGLELLLLGDEAAVSRHPVLAPRGRAIFGSRTLAPYGPEVEVPLEGSAGLLVAQVLAPLLRDHGPIGPDPVEQDVAVLLLLVAVPNDHI